MKDLYNFILEAAEGKDLKFINTVNKLEDLPDEMNIFKASEEVRNAFQAVAKSQIHDTPFLFAKDALYFKMPYCYNNSIIKNLDGVAGIIIKKHGKKILVYYKSPVEKTKRKNGIQLMETGNGSLKKIPTESQENATCVIFNAYMDVIGENQMMLENPEDMYKEPVIQEIVKDLVGVMGDSWIRSFSLQIMTIVEYLKNLGMPYDTIANYRLARYGAESDTEQVSFAYTRMIKEYSKLMGGRKDAYDPTDVLLFNKGKDKENINKITSCCNNILNMISSKDTKKINDAKAEFLKDFFETHICMGISLKKLHNKGRIELFNVSGKEDIVEYVTGFKKCPPSERGNYMQISCEGSFKFKEGFTDGDGDKLVNTKEVILTLRTFGGGNAYIDVNLPDGGPAIGKCPVNIWRKYIKPVSKDLDSCKKAFDKFLETDEKVLEKLKIIIQGAVKEGPSCFPFILLH